MHVALKILLHIVAIVLLTIISQIGGIVYFLVILTCNKNKERYRLKRFGLFTGIYLLSTFLIVPVLAPFWGREKIKNTEFVCAHSFYIILFNRNYVKPELNRALKEISIRLNKFEKDLKLVYLDASFPFIDRFPLLPHLSHNDGEKLDVSLIYENEEGEIVNKKPSISGYGIFVDPTPNEYNATEYCKKHGHWQYDFTKYLTFGRINRNIKFSPKGTRNLLRAIVLQPEIRKVFIEPHLKNKLKVNSKKIRFHGCIAVRHDDHIHFQL